MCGGEGRTARILSPGTTVPPSDTIAITPALKRGPANPPSSRTFNPALKRSMRTQGVRRPVSSRAAEGPSRSTVPSGKRSRSRPTVATSRRDPQRGPRSRPPATCRTARWE